MTTTRSFMNQVWIDLNSPTREEVDSLMLTQNISPMIAKDLLTPTPTQYAKDDGSSIYTVLHIPAFKSSHAVTGTQEIDFIISKSGLITARYDSIDALHYFDKQAEVSEILNKGSNSHLFFEMMREIYSSMSNELAYIEDWMKQIEDSIFEGREKEMVFVISNVGRDLLNFKRIVDPHGTVLEFLKVSGGDKFGPEFREKTQSLLEEWKRIMRIVNNQVDLMVELRETNNSMLSTKQNEIMKQLAAIGSILLPMTLVGQVFGLSVRSFPFMNHPFAFWIVIGIMVSVMVISLIFAKIKKWM